MKKEQLKKLYIESKKSEDNEDFIRIIKKQLQDVLSGFGFEVDCVGAIECFGSKKNRFVVTTTTVLLRRGRDFYMTRRINALIDLIFSTDLNEKTLFDIIYNRV